MRSTAMPRDAAALSRNDRYANSAVASNSASSSGVKLRLSPSRFAYLPRRRGHGFRALAAPVLLLPMRMLAV
jgi:hypothetical protein